MSRTSTTAATTTLITASRVIRRSRRPAAFATPTGIALSRANTEAIPMDSRFAPGGDGRPGGAFVGAPAEEAAIVGLSRWEVAELDEYVWHDSPR